MAKIKQPTTTSLVLEQLICNMETTNCFMTVAMLVTATGRNKPGEVRAALFTLRKYQAVDVVVNNDGIGWWFATGNDTRSRMYKEIVPEIHRKRKQRKE